MSCAASAPRGVGIVYVSHRLEEVFALADRITVLRDGESIATRPRADMSPGELVRLMVGRELTAVYPKRPVPLGGVALELRDVSNRARALQPVSLTLRRGEILGLAGLVGSGRTELAETIFGLTPCDGGVIAVNGAAVAVSVAGRRHPGGDGVSARGSPTARGRPADVGGGEHDV